MCMQYIPGSVLPVIMVSAKSDEDNIVEGLRSGSNDFVRKPYQREELLVGACLDGKLSAQLVCMTSSCVFHRTSIASALLV